MLSRKMLLDDVEKVLSRRYAGNMRAEEPGTVLALGVVAAELAHEERPLLVAEPLAAQLIVPEQALLLLFQARLRLNRLAADGRGGLGKKPRPAQCRAGNHHAIDAIAAE